MHIPTTETARLVLRPFREEDAAPLHRILSEENVLRYFPNPSPPTRDRVERLIATQLEHWTQHGYGWWAVAPREVWPTSDACRAGRDPPAQPPKSTGDLRPSVPLCRHHLPALYGWCGLGFLPETNEVEVAYLLGKPFWGRGYATEAARASVRYGFETIGVDEIVAIVHPENTASRRVIAKLGMSFTRHARYFGIDCERYALAKGAFA
jgi:ribosomal-protein-alanine N-acetyltransferase